MKNTWPMGEAKDKLSEVCEAAQKVPQRITNRGKYVATVSRENTLVVTPIKSEEFNAFLENITAVTSQLDSADPGLELPERQLEESRDPFSEEGQ